MFTPASLRRPIPTATNKKEVVGGGWEDVVTVITSVAALA
jgi:hypothetical protein